MQTIIADDRDSFKSMSAWCEHYVEKIDETTAVMFKKVNHINIRVYVSNIAKRCDRKMRTKSLKGDILVWLDMPQIEFPPIPQSEDRETSFMAVYDKASGLDQVRARTGESLKDFCRRVLAPLPVRSHVRIFYHGATEQQKWNTVTKLTTIRQYAYSHANMMSRRYSTEAEDEYVQVKRNG